MKQTHTPGPWNVDINAGETSGNLYNHENDGERFAVVHFNNSATAIHDATLIASAPELLAALEMTTNLLGARGRLDKTVVEQVLQEAFIAIAKAKGG